MKTWNSLSMESELESLRKRWKEAKNKGDLVMAKLWEKLGKKLKEKIENETN